VILPEMYAAFLTREAVILTLFRECGVDRTTGLKIILKII